MNNKPANTRSYAAKQRSEPGKGDGIPCARCGALALDTGLECDECGYDNYEAVTGKPFSTVPEEAMTDLTSTRRLMWQPLSKVRTLSPEQIERHKLTAGECPSGSEVLLVSSVRRLLGCGIGDEKPCPDQ